MALWLGGTVLALYAALVLAVYLSQRKLLYFPDTDRPEAHYLRYSHLAYWPSEFRYLGLVATNEPVSPRGTCLVFHGNAGRAVDRTYFVEALERLGWRVVLAEYPGYGGREGVPGEATLVASGREAIGAAQAQWGGPIVLVGESLGAGVVAAIAADPPAPVAGALLITPWATLPNLAQSTFPFLPARWLVRDRFDSIAHLRQAQLPVAIALAQEDEVIPARHGRRLYAAIPEPKRLWVFPGVGHNDWPSLPEAPWWGEALEFVEASALSLRQKRQ